jgi:hypothetical protein
MSAPRAPRQEWNKTPRDGAQQGGRDFSERDGRTVFVKGFDKWVPARARAGRWG